MYDMTSRGGMSAAKRLMKTSSSFGVSCSSSFSSSSSSLSSGSSVLCCCGFSFLDRRGFALYRHPPSLPEAANPSSPNYNSRWWEKDERFQIHKTVTDHHRKNNEHLKVGPYKRGRFFASPREDPATFIQNVLIIGVTIYSACTLTPGEPFHVRRKRILHERLLKEYGLNEEDLDEIEGDEIEISE